MPAGGLQWLHWCEGVKFDLSEEQTTSGSGENSGDTYTGQTI